MKLTIVNISTSISNDEFGRVVAAIQKQVTEHFQPEWGKSAKLRTASLTVGPHAAPIDGSPDAIIYVGDSSQDPTTGVTGALGYHGRNHGKVPYGFIYLDICAKYGDAWSSTLSHEVLELLEDPTAIKVVAAPAPGYPDITVYYDLEVCDPTQGDSYDIDGVTVSNFVGRAYFGQIGGSGRTNYLDLILEPFGVRPKGYFQFEYGSEVYQVNGQRVTQSAVDARRLMGKVRRNARRAGRVQRDGTLGVGVSVGPSGPGINVAGVLHFDRVPHLDTPSPRPSAGIQRDGSVSVSGTAGSSGSSVTGSVTIHFDKVPLVGDTVELSGGAPLRLPGLHTNGASASQSRA